MGRRRRSLLGKSKKASSPEKESAPAEETPLDEAPTVDEAPTADEPAEEEEPPTLDSSADDEAVPDPSATGEFAPSGADFGESDGFVEASEHATDLEDDHPYSDPDAYAEAETQMDEPVPEAFSDGFAEELHGDDGMYHPETSQPGGSVFDEPEPDLGSEPSVDDDDAPRAIPPVPPPPMQGILDDDPNLYGDFDDLGNPPTEEVALYQDVSQPHGGPMNVPDAPPVPGLEDRFTPAPVERTEIGGRQASERPTYLATPTPAPSERAFPPKEQPAGLVRDDRMDTRDIQFSRYDDEDDDEEESPGMLRWVALAVVLVLIIGLAMGIGGSMLYFAATSGTPAATEVPDDIRGVKVEKGGVKKDGPELLGDVDEDGSEEAGEDVGIPGPPIEEDEPEGEDIEEGVEDEAVEEAAPKPRPRLLKPKATPSKLMIRANRRVLVYVDGKAAGYTPIDFEVSPGAHEVVAMVAGQPATKQSKSATIAEDGDSATVEFSF